MTTLRRFLLATLALSSLGVPAAQAQGVGAPALQPGDTWTYRVNVSREGRPDALFHPRLSALRQEAGRWIFTLGTVGELPGTIQLMKGWLDAGACIVDVVPIQSLQSPPCATSAKEGDAWTMPFEDDGIRELRVRGAERLQVPAGTFDTLRLEEVDRPGPDAGGERKAPSSRATLWVATSLGIVIRAERETLRPDGTVAMHKVDVLESFGHGNAERIATNRLPPPERRAKRAPQVVLTTACRPKYPPDAVRANTTGVTQIRVAVDADGHVTDTELIGASGKTPLHRLLDETARESIAKCSFRPATSASGSPEAAIVDVGYDWRIE